MLTPCPECGEQVSDKAYSCPHCGYPLTKTKPPLRPPKRMRLPNGFGRITKLSGRNLRKPYRVMVTVGKDENGRPIGKILKPNGYFATYNEAYQALTEYNRSPYDLTQSITMDELFQRWFKEYKEKVTEKRAKDMERCWSYCSSIHDMDVTLVRTRTIKELLASLDKTEQVKTWSKGIISMMFDYAVEYEYLSRNCVKDIKSSEKKPQTEAAHHIFTDEEFEVIAENKDVPPYDMIYVQCYTGMRPNELCSVTINRINMSDWYIIGGSKTDAGRDRMIPLHENIRSIIQRKYNEAFVDGRKTLFGIGYKGYYNHFKEVFPEHKPHDSRKHFITRAKKAGMDEYAIKLIVGHAIADLTESVYTERDIVWLHRELAKLP